MQTKGSFKDFLRQEKRVLAEHLVFNRYPTLPTLRILEALSTGVIDNKQADSLLMIKHAVLITG